MQTALYLNNKRFTEKEFSKEKELEEFQIVIADNSNMNEIISLLVEIQK